MKSRVRSASVLFVALGTMGGAVGHFCAFFKQFCGEEALYRTRWALYACEQNDESHPDFACYRRVAGLSGFLSLDELSPEECVGERDVWVPWHPANLDWQ